MNKDDIRNAALAAAANRIRCGIAVSVGGGKTAIGLYHMANEYNKGNRSFLVVAPKLSIIQSWKDEAEKFKLQHLSPCITFVTYLSLPKLNLSDFHFIYLDECHSLLYTHHPVLASYTRGIFGLTGSPPRYAKSEKGEMVNAFCPIVYTYETDEGIDDGLLNDYRIIIHHLHLGTSKNVPNKRKDGGIWYQSEQAAYDYWNNKLEDLDSNVQQVRIMRMKALMNAPTKVGYAKQLIQGSNNKIIVFANTQEQADIISKFSFHSKNEHSDLNLDMFKKGMIRELSTVMQLNEGVNIPNLREGVILHAYSNERKATQRIGRLLRLNPNDTAIAHILCFDGTVDETWVEDALSDYDRSKIYHYYPTMNELLNFYGEPVEEVKIPGNNYRPFKTKELQWT